MNMKHLKLAVAALLVAVSAVAAVALDIDQSRNTVARELSTQQVSYYRITVNYNDPRISTAQKFGALKQHAYIHSVSCHVLTAFNGGSTNVFTVGTTLASANEIINASTSTQSIDETSATYQSITAASSLGESVTSAADVNLYAKYTQTGTPATAGKLTCVIGFVPNNDM